MTTNVSYLPTGAPTGSPANEVAPCVGMPARFQIGSDFYQGTIVAVYRGGRSVEWQREHDRSDVKTFTRRADGSYWLRGCNHGRLYLGDDSPTDLDPSF